MTTRYAVLTYSNGQRAYLDLPDTTAALGEAVADGPDNLIHGSGVLGGHVEVLAEAIDEAMSLDGITAGDHQRKRRTDRKHVGQEPTVQVGQVHAAVTVLAAASSGKAASTRVGWDG
jgi:hypothetical protein